MPEASAPFRAGFAAIVGRPNVGKSTLLNALMGEKLSIVTSRPQTTRHRVLGVLNRPGVQLAFVDTPGLHLGERRALNRAMNRTAAAALADADLVVFVVEALRFGEEDEAVLQRIRDAGRESIVVINKVDKVPQKDRLLPFTAELAAKHGFLDVVPVSAEKGVNLDRLVDVIAARMPESPELFPPEQRTDRGEDFQITETIREKLTMELVEEVPYGIAVEIEKKEEVEGRLVIDAVVWVDREGQKPIVIGAKGSRLKRIGQKARAQVFSVIEGIPRQLVAALCVVVFAFFFVTVAARIVGLVGVTSNPTSGMTIAALLGTATVFLAIGWTDATGKAAALMVGCVVAIAASISGDTSQDLKTGFLLGATPRNQQLAQLAGVLTSATFVCLSVLLLAETFGFGGKELPAPQATLMKLVIDGVIDQSLPWGLVGIGVGIALAAELARIPSLPFAVGVYLPLSTMTPIFLGGLLRWLLVRRQDAARAEARTGRGVLLGSGFVGGEGLLGVGLAGAAFMLGRKPDGFGHDWAGEAGAWAMGAVAFAILAVWFARRVRAAPT